MNKVYLHNVNGEVPNRERAIGTILLPYVKNKHFSE